MKAYEITYIDPRDADYHRDLIDAKNRYDALTRCQNVKWEVIEIIEK